MSIEKIWIKGALIIDSQSPYHLQKCHLAIQQGKIVHILKAQATLPMIDAHTRVIDAEDMALSIGFMDMRTALNEPGLEHKETLESLCRAAWKGGFTDIATLPQTLPPIQQKQQIAFLRHYTQADAPVKLHPIAALSENLEGVRMNEFYDLHTHGAVAFSDGTHTLQNAALMLRALRYMRAFDGLIMQFAQNQDLVESGDMHEGVTSTYLGLKPITALSEVVQIQRDLKILEYTGGKLHFSTLSTAESVKLIRQAKAEGLAVSCDIAAAQLSFLDSDLENFDTNLKVNPPFRTEKDRKALIQGIQDGTIDAIVSHHQPQDQESKKLEFDLAEFGILNLQTAFAAIHTATKELLPVELIIDKMSSAPRKILGCKIPTIQEGQEAVLTLIAPKEEWILTEQTIISESKNSPFVGKKLSGCIKAVFQQDKYEIF
ncbi:MAG: dihydroorotase [Bernardetiaceae bacterium]|nr:dihydroorotase [Bernardetiaceae bacterium]